MKKRTEKKQKPKLSKYFTLKKVLDILCEYDVVHFDVNLDSILNEKLFGFVNFAEKKIYINKNQSKSEMRDTLIHEMLHIIEDELVEETDEDNVWKESSKVVKAVYHPPKQIKRKGDKHDRETNTEDIQA